MEQLKEMEGIVEKIEKKKDEDITQEAIKEFEEEEFKGLTPEERARKERFLREEREKLDAWVPRTQLGKDVKSGKIKNISEIINKGKKVLEAEIVDTLIPNLQTDVLFIGQAKVNSEVGKEEHLGKRKK